MATQIVRTGNAFMVEIPQELVADAGFEIGEALEWAVDGKGHVTLWRPADLAASKAQKHLTLEELLEGVPEGGITGEYDWGPPQGVEVW